MSSKWIELRTVQSKNGPVKMVCPRKVITEDSLQKDLKMLLSPEKDMLDAARLQELKKRKLIKEVSSKSYILTKGPKFTLDSQKPETDLTAQMIKDGSWKEKTFKAYNFNSLGTPLACGHLHPLMKVRSAYRQIFLEMGFSEMPTNNFVESSFWNFDSLFQPQQHPARDAHDTFFISDPKLTTQFPEDYLKRVKSVHSEGGYGSQVGLHDRFQETHQFNF